MKHFIRYLSLLSLMLLTSSGAWADTTVTIIKQLEGTADATASPGEVTWAVNEGVCTLTVTPAEGNYITAAYIIVRTTIMGDVAQGRKNIPGPNFSILPLTATDPNADPSLTTTYTFDMPTDGSDVEVTANFQKTQTIVPIVDEDDDETGDGVPTTNVTFSLEDFTDSEGNPIDLSNVVVGDVLYNVPKTSPDDPQGFSPATDDAPAGIVLTTSMTEDDIAHADGEEPGSGAYAEAFKGITLLLPAGTGRIRIVAQTDPGAVLYVRIGDDDPIAIKDVTFEDETWIQYERPTDTYVKIYLAPQDAGSRRKQKKSVFRDKRETAGVRVTGLGVSSSSLITAGATSGQPLQVKVYELLADNFANGGHGIVLSSVCDNPVTDLGSNVFGAVDDKPSIDFIDMSATALQGFGFAAPSRSESRQTPASGRLDGLLEGYDAHTLVFLPEGNSDGGDSNIIIDDVCSNLILDADHSFCTPRDFTAASVSLGRTFTPGRATTLMLPFDITAFNASELGTFHRFTKMEDNAVLFDEAEYGPIEANTPYIFVPEATELTVNSVDVKAIDDDAPVLSDIFFGTYTKQLAPARTFALVPATNTNGMIYGQFLPLAGDDELEPFSAYLRVDGEVSALYMVIGKEIPTGIETVNNDDVHSMALYNLGGQRVACPRKGLYIAKGRKIVFK